jgi:hypothetical protein
MIKPYREFYDIYRDRPITPIFGTRVGIWDKYVNGAIKEGLRMRVFTTKGIAIHNAKDWKANATLGEKVMLRPDEPMKLYYGDLKILPVEEPTQEDKWKEFSKSL